MKCKWIQDIEGGSEREITYAPYHLRLNRNKYVCIYWKWLLHWTLKWYWSSSGTFIPQSYIPRASSVSCETRSDVARTEPTQFQIEFLNISTQFKLSSPFPDSGMRTHTHGTLLSSHLVMLLHLTPSVLSTLLTVHSGGTSIDQSLEYDSGPCFADGWRTQTHNILTVR